MTYRLAEEEVMKAKDVDLLSYLEAKGEKFQKRETITDIRSTIAC